MAGKNSTLTRRNWWIWVCAFALCVPIISKLYRSSLIRNPPTDNLHGPIGVYPDGTPAWSPAPLLEIKNVNKALMQGGGFLLEVSDSIPLDRPMPEMRDSVCLQQRYDLEKLPSASVIVTFFNEEMSTLLRTVHSILNRTPPSLLAELLLVDDASTKEHLKKPLEDYLKLLPPSVKLVRLTERHGIVRARLAGAEMSKGEVIVVLDSHIEVERQWLEPLLLRISQDRTVLVTPQIDSIVADTFELTDTVGIGCFLAMKWTGVEHAFLTEKGLTKADPIASPVIAGGLFAVEKKFFFEMGGYDEEMSVWGAENLEMSFRFWLCGARVECMPCSRIAHLFRKGEGRQYTIPLHHVWRNRLRTARVWMDEFHEIVAAYNYHPELDLGSFDKMLELKKRRQCKPFEYFLQEVHPTNPIGQISDVAKGVASVPLGIRTCAEKDTDYWSFPALPDNPKLISMVWESPNSGGPKCLTAGKGKGGIVLKLESCGDPRPENLFRPEPFPSKAYSPIAPSVI